jgi:pimeloyl-ACP methyl ester carboxylesterase
MNGFHNDGMRFDVSDTGPADGRPVVLLHGFPADRTAWDAVAPGLAADGCRVLAPDQRGYSPGARPLRRRDYRMSRLVGDVLALADQAGADRFDVVGHDWGALVAHHLAAHHPRRIRTVTAVSGPHPGAWRQSLLRSSQAARSAYMVLFQIPVLPERILRSRLHRMLIRDGLDAGHARRYAARAARPRGLTGPLNWYRAIPLERWRSRAVPTPTLLVHGGRDRFITRTAAELSRRWVTGPCRLEILDGVSHWVPEQAAEELTSLIRSHLAATPV